MSIPGYARDAELDLGDRTAAQPRHGDNSVRAWAARGSTVLILLAAGAGAVRAQDTEPDSLRASAGVRDRMPPPAIVEDEFSTRAALEIGAVALTGVAHLGLASVDAGPLLIPIATLGWGG